MILMNKHQNIGKTVRQTYNIDASPNRREARQNADIGGSNSNRLAYLACIALLQGHRQDETSKIERSIHNNPLFSYFTLLLLLQDSY